MTHLSRGSLSKTEMQIGPIIKARFGALRSVARSLLMVTFALYAVAMTCSMAAMEILSWTTGLLTIIYLLIDYFSGEPEIKLVRTGYGFLILLFIGICSLGVFINAPSENWVRDLGALRDLLLFFFFFYSFKIFKDTTKLFILMLSCGTIISVYGIWQHFSGIDLWRHDHRALVQVPWGEVTRFATVGFFNHHLTYAYSFGMIICIAWSLIVLKTPKTNFEKIALPISFLLIFASLICTYSRGAWAGLAIVIPAMVFLACRKYFFAILGIIILLVCTLYFTDSMFRQRLQTVTQGGYFSNQDRKNLWEINFQMFKEHPIVGVGYLENEPLSGTYFKKLNIVGGMGGHAHSNYFEFLSTSGVLGFVAYLALIFTPFIASVKLFFKLRVISTTDALYDRCILLAAIGAQLMFHIGGFTQCTVCDSKVLHQFVFWLTIVYFLNDKYKTNLTDNRHQEPSTPTAV
jgi:O-antigen ligase